MQKQERKKVILYGAGNMGKEVFGFLNLQELESTVYAFCDQKQDILNLEGKQVISYQEARQQNLPFVITVTPNTVAYQEIESRLKEDAVEYYADIVDYEILVLGFDRVKVNRDYCAYYHMEHMNPYFLRAENEDSIKTFWGKGSAFLNLFEQLDLQNVVELACGHGRHVPYYIARAQNITLVDVLGKNIDFVKERFASYKNISYYQNNGHDLLKLPDKKYTALFTYDAMVHFELLDIYEYLRETYRILVSGGKALFHHSNDNSDYKSSFLHCANRSGRNYMSKDIFAYLVYRSGLEIVEQRVIDWGGREDLDCISFVKKPS